MLWMATMALASDALVVEVPRFSGAEDPPAWVVRQGDGPPLDTPALLTILDDPDAWRAYEGLQARDHRRGWLWAAGSGVGLVLGTTAAMLGGSWVIRDRQQRPQLTGEGVHLGIPVAILGGAVALTSSGTIWASGVPWRRRRHREARPDAFFDPTGVALYVDSHNLDGIAP